MCVWIVVVALAGVACATDWPGWRGADRTGVSSETGLLKTWPEGGPKLLWKATGLGGGFSTPSVAKGRIYLLGSKNKEEYVIALDAKDGSQLWATKIGAAGKSGPPPYEGPRSTPTVDGEHLFVLGSDGDLACLDNAGKIVWRINLEKDLGGQRGRWAYAESPLSDGDVLVCTPGGSQATLAGLNKKTGEVVWKTPVPGGEAAYASVIIAEVGGVKQYVQLLGNSVVGVAAKDGKLLWSHDFAGRTNCPTPIFHNGCIFITHLGPGVAACALLRLSVDGSNVSAKQVYMGKDLAIHHGGAVQVGDYVYGTNNDALVCLDFKTGETKWKDRSVGKGSISAADGRLYVRGESDGQVALVEATPAGYKESGRLKQPTRSKQKAWPHPVVANGCLYLRDDDVLLCYDIKAQ
jgi:outer membrane protein assembly factor BamB